ncbi:MAG TPA: hypothetical protein VMC10_14130 [Stellaceae bacterium]|nr:hypothetical protein [Stellaceae bacterium]HUN48023.1 hypothetical protein [Stellaceae bacterium]
MAQYSFGSGVLFGTRSDVANATPIRFGALQDVSIDFSFTLKELFGQYQFPLAVGRGTGKISGKAKFAQINGLTLNSLFFGQSTAAGQTLTSLTEAQSVPAATPYTVTVANAASFAADLGVVYAATGLPLTKVASAPAQGQYAVSAAGVYTFAAADASAAILVSYTYTQASGGVTATIANQLLGTAPTFQANFYETFNGKQVNLQLNQCVGEKLTIATKQEDFTIPEFDFMAFADAAGNIGKISVAE